MFVSRLAFLLYVFVEHRVLEGDYKWGSRGVESGCTCENILTTLSKLSQNIYESVTAVSSNVMHTDSLMSRLIAWGEG